MLTINKNLMVGAGIEVTDTNLSAISLKQQGKLSNTAGTSVYGYKVYNDTTDDAYYSGFDTSGNLTTFYETAFQTFTPLTSLNTTTLNMNNLRISNLGNPVNPQDAMTFGLNPTYYVSGLLELLIGLECLR